MQSIRTRAWYIGLVLTLALLLPMGLAAFQCLSGQNNVSAEHATTHKHHHEPEKSEAPISNSCHEGGCVLCVAGVPPLGAKGPALSMRWPDALQGREPAFQPLGQVRKSAAIFATEVSPRAPPATA
jgi:hypothetical protein